MSIFHRSTYRFHENESWSVQCDDGFPEYLQAIYRYMTLGLTLSGLIAYVCARSSLYQTMTSSPYICALLLIMPLIFVVVLSTRIDQISLVRAKIYFWLFAIMIGFSFAGIFQVYLGEGIAKAFFETAGAFVVISVIGFVTRKNLSRMSTFLMLSLVGVILAGLVNFWISSDLLNFMISASGIVIFSLLTAFDTYMIEKRFYAVTFNGEDDVIRNPDPIQGALNLYLDFINIFISLLKFKPIKY